MYVINLDNIQSTNGLYCNLVVSTCIFVWEFDSHADGSEVPERHRLCGHRVKENGGKDIERVY